MPIVSSDVSYSFGHCMQFHKEQLQTQTVEPGSLTRYLIWSLRSHFLIVLLTEACAFLALTCIFAICIYAGASYQPQCLVFPGGRNFEESGSFFLDAFSVSWTTFSTVVSEVGLSFVAWKDALLSFILQIRDMEWYTLKFGENRIKRHSTVHS